MIGIIKIVSVNCLITLLLIILFDVAMFSFLPERYVFNFDEYRQNRTPAPDVLGKTALPKSYFVENEERGFDIGRNKSTYHWVDGTTYPIWSNSLGCFDNEHSVYDQYIYFAGDSITWGFAPFDQKFGTIIERETGVQILKCGVTNTGQHHQFSKFVEIVRDIGKPPKAIFVFYFSNDVANDFAHPHTTVIEGWPVDSVYLDENDEIVRISRQELMQKLTDKMKMNEKRFIKWGWRESAKHTLKNYSLTTNIIVHFKHYSAYKLSAMQPSRQIHSKRKTERAFFKLPYEKNGRYWFRDNQFAQENKEALIDFKNYSEQNNMRFSVILVPNKKRFRNMNYYEEVHEFLDQNEIDYLDLAIGFADKKMSQTELYWKKDGHLNPSGNAIVSEILMNEYPDIFQTR